MRAFDATVPCCSCAKSLRECVQRGLAQDGIEVSVLIIDDATPNEPLAVAADLVASDARLSYQRCDRISTACWA